MSANAYADLLSDAPGPRALLEQSLRLLEADFRERALLAIADWERKVHLATPGLLPAVSALRRPTWGHWNGLLQDLRKAHGAILQKGTPAERDAVQRATVLYRVLDLLDTTLPPDLIQQLHPLAQLTRKPLRARTPLGQVLELPIALRNRMVHTNPNDAWYARAAEALRPLLDYHAGSELVGGLRCDDLPRLTPWFQTEYPGTASEKLWVFNGLAEDWSVEYVSRHHDVRSDTGLVQQEILIALQRLLGEADAQEERFASLRALLTRYAPDEFKGVLMGDYLVCRPVGGGGFATVHLGQQLSTGHKVAIKILLDSLPEEQQRFQDEAKYLAQFNHPHIVRVLGQGTGPWRSLKDNLVADAPWFATFKRSQVKTYMALEWVEGRTLEAVSRFDSAIDILHGATEGQRRTLAEMPDLEAQSPPELPEPVIRAAETLQAERTNAETLDTVLARVTESRPDRATLIEWFAQAAEALTVVHQVGLIHRDIKPSNLMVTVDGKIKLMDFGIARSHAEDRALRTRTRQLLGTPAYMSPEQRAARDARTAEAVGAASDIYSLCATFYQLFTGRLPPSDEVPAPLGVAKSGGLWPNGLRLPRELVTLIEGGLQAQIVDRPHSMDLLARDLRHIQRFEPIEYRRPWWGRRLQLFYRRQRTVVNLVVSFLVLSILGVATYIVSIRAERDRTAEQRGEAVKNAETSERRFDYAQQTVEEMLEKVGETELLAIPLMEESRRKLLLKAQAFYEKLLADKEDDPKSRLIVGRAYRKVGQINRQLGRYPDAAIALQEASGRLERLVAEYPDQPEYRGEWATTLSERGVLEVSRSRQSDAERFFRQSLDVRLQLAKDFPDEESHRDTLASSYRTLSSVLSDRPAEAEEVLSRALALYRRLLEKHPTDLSQRLALAGTYFDLVGIHRIQHRYGKALEVLGEAARLLSKATSSLRPADRVRAEALRVLVQTRLAKFALEEGALLLLVGEIQMAERAFSRAVDIYEPLVRDFPSLPQHRADLGTTYMGLAALHGNLGRPEPSAKSLAAAHEHFLWLVDRFPTVDRFAYGLVYCQNSMAASAGNDPHKTPEAERFLRANVQYWEKRAAAFSSAHVFQFGLASNQVSLGHLLLKSGRAKDAEQLFDHALALGDQLLRVEAGNRDYRSALAAALSGRAEARQAANRLPEAEEALRQSLAIWKKLAVDFPGVADYRDKMASVYIELGDVLAARHQPKPAEEAYRQALAIQEQLHKDAPATGPYQINQGKFHRKLANLFVDNDRPADALREYREAVSIFEKLATAFPDLVVGQLGLAATYHSLGWLHVRQQQSKEAALAYGHSARVLEGLLARKLLPPISVPSLAITQTMLGLVFKESRRYQEAEAPFRRALAVYDQLAALSPAQADYRYEAARSQGRLGDTLWELKRLEEADKALAGAIARLEKLATEFPRVEEYRSRLAGDVMNRGILLSGLRPADAGPLHQHAVKVYQGLIADFPKQPDHRTSLARTFHNLGLWSSEHKQPKQAEQAYRQAQRQWAELAAGFPKEPEYRREAAQSANTLGWFLESGRRHAEAVPVYKEAVKWWRVCVAAVPKESSHRAELARTQTNLGNTFAALGKPAEAATHCREAIRLREALAAEFPLEAAYRRDLAFNFFQQAQRATGPDRAKEAEAAYRRAIALRQQLAEDFPKEHDYRYYLAATHDELAALYVRTNRPIEAEKSYRTGIDLLKKLTIEAPGNASYWGDRGEAEVDFARLLMRRQPTQARQMAADAVECYKHARKKQPTDKGHLRGLGKALKGLADILIEQQDHVRAVQTSAELAPLLPAGGEGYRRSAELVARCIPLAQKDAGLSDERRKATAQQYTERAIALLRQATAKGYRDAPALRKAPEFASLKDHPDFQKLLADLEGKGPKNAPP